MRLLAALLIILALIVTALGIGWLIAQGAKPPHDPSDEGADADDPTLASRFPSACWPERYTVHKQGKALGLHRPIRPIQKDEGADAEWPSPTGRG